MKINRTIVRCCNKNSENKENVKKWFVSMHTTASFNNAITEGLPISSLMKILITTIEFVTKVNRKLQKNKR
ncbi:hypothetical protein B1B04_18485 [Lysinibacillus sp. KCTC 33748]|nr:hypothetical protein B1B04_18485 [Lysinibacillus sp. KCTC 33748]